ncbi:MAG TPA: hypothetical protein VKY59_17270 [Spirillospora sp.]|nr:hypothetical protein [Spirillospora sp.]
MTVLEKNILSYGSPDPLPEAVELRAGPVTVQYAGGDIRYIRVGPHEILRRVYAAVRDHNWHTITPRIHNEQIEQRDDGFQVDFDAVHVQGDIDFTWHGRITGAADGTIIFTFDGVANATFRRNRIGFCVLHPTHLAGQPCTVRHVDGREADSRFPLYISPHQPFFDIRAIAHEVAPGLRAEVLMEGETFEMEDQRNWTDASYKTYCTPLGLPFPVTVEQGTTIQQAITIRLYGDAPSVGDSQKPALTFRITDQVVPLPALGLGVASHAEPLTEAEIARLTVLNPAHLRVDLWLNGETWRAALQQASREAHALGSGLEIALFLSDAAEAELDALKAALADIQAPVARWLIFHSGEKSTREQWLLLARDRLGDTGAPIGTGTDYFFTELNRERPPVAAADCIVYSINPQVHAFDNVDLIETLAVQATTVESARQFSAGKPIVISPVTLKMRRNPNATGPQPETPPGQLPPQVDARQMSLFGAVWTLGSIKHLAEAGAHSVTYYETSGWRGVMETTSGAPVPDQFPSIPGGVFTLYHVLADVGEFAGGEVVRSESSDSLIFDGLVLRAAGRERILLANYTPQPQTITLPDVQGRVTIRRLDDSNAEDAMRAPEAYRQSAGTPGQGDAGGLRIDLPPYGVVRVDLG